MVEVGLNKLREDYEYYKWRQEVLGKTFLTFEQFILSEQKEAPCQK